MSRANAIRKRAQERVKKRDWVGAIKEYRQLSELDQSNPNVYNELGDIYLKVDQKMDALKSFEKAVDAYARVGLFNNAVAVCKKLLRLQSGSYEIIGKLASLRKQQGLLKEAATYYLSYLEKIVLDVNIDPGEMKKKVAAIAGEIPESPEVLEKVSECLTKWESPEEAAKVLLRLQKLYKKKGMAAQVEDVQDRLNDLGVNLESVEPASVSLHEEAARSKEELWTPPIPGEGARIQTDQNAPEAPQTAESASGGASPQSGAAGLEIPGHEGPAPHALADSPNPSVTEEESAQPGQPTQSPPGADQPQTISPDGNPLSEGDVWIPNKEIPEPLNSGAGEDKGSVVHVSQIIDEFKSEVRGTVDEEDHRSHYDLGMAYLEMDFLDEAIREFQLAAKSSSYQVRSLEMIGLCFIKQNQPSLAIKQLEKGLEYVGGSDRETLGLLYNLGLAYEMVGDIEKAKSCFEDVYVVDVTFREVTEKIKKYSG